jgi:regulator of PEP synthase PpsR (kinase-PPPase family)
VDLDKLQEEIISSKKLFARMRWPVIDVTRRSVEETAAAIIQMIQERRAKA